MTRVAGDGDSHGRHASPITAVSRPGCVHLSIDANPELFLCLLLLVGFCSVVAGYRMSARSPASRPG